MTKASHTSLVGSYYSLVKPGIIRGNLLAATAGFFLASKRHVDIWLFVALLAGTSLVIASGCVFNNYIDREIDKKMSRTKNRALASGVISVKAALLFGSILGVLGLLVLALFTNWLTVGVGVGGWFFYVVVYSFWKRKNEFGTLVGGISGATPPLAGYVAVTGHIDVAAGLLFLILLFWQMPHFYAIALFRRADYANANIPVLPVAKSLKRTKSEVLIYTCLFFTSTLFLTITGYTAWVYSVVMSVLCLAWLYRGIAGFNHPDDVKWARGMFGFSLIVLSVFCVLVSLTAILP